MRAAGRRGCEAAGRLRPSRWGGDRRSHRVEAHKGLIGATCRRKPAVFLRELRDDLARRGVQASTSSLGLFFARHGITRKKGTGTPPSSTGRT